MYLIFVLVGGHVKGQVGYCDVFWKPKVEGRRAYERESRLDIRLERRSARIWPSSEANLDMQRGWLPPPPKHLFEMCL